jgi:hypothetical protein
MKTASVNEIKQKLKQLDTEELIELNLRLARFKKENKELLTYLIFEADDEEGYINGVKEEIDEGFREINSSSLYLVKKTLRRLLRMVNKYIRYTGSKTAEVELLLHYAKQFSELELPLHKSPALKNIYDGQLKKIATVLSGMHEDLQYDYLKKLERL